MGFPWATKPLGCSITYSKFPLKTFLDLTGTIIRVTWLP